MDRGEWRVFMDYIEAAKEQLDAAFEFVESIDGWDQAAERHWNDGLKRIERAIQELEDAS